MRHPSIFLRIVSVSSALALILIAFFFPAILAGIELPLLFLSVFLIGIPHGAIDHVMASEIFNLKKTLGSHLLFYGSYLLIMLFVGAIWVFLPVLGMIFFLLISVYHFGQADMEDFMEDHRGLSDRFLHSIRGVLIIGCIVFSDLSMTVPVMADAMALQANELLAWMPDANVALLVIFGIYLISIVFATFQKRFTSPVSVLLDSVLLIAMFLITGPFIGFAVYFALWHSAGHVQEMREYFQEHQKNLSLAPTGAMNDHIGLFLLQQVNRALWCGFGDHHQHRQAQGTPRIGHRQSRISTRGGNQPLCTLRGIVLRRISDPPHFKGSRRLQGIHFRKNPRSADV